MFEKWTKRLASLECLRGSYIPGDQEPTGFENEDGENDESLCCRRRNVRHRTAGDRGTGWPRSLRARAKPPGKTSDADGNVIHTRCDLLAGAPTFPQLDVPLNGLAYLPGTINLKPLHLLRRKDFVQDLEVNYLGAVNTSSTTYRSCGRPTAPRSS